MALVVPPSAGGSQTAWNRLAANSINDLVRAVFGTVPGTVSNAVTFDITGGAAPGAVFDGTGAVTVDYSTVGAQVAGTYLTANQTITLSGDVTGSGTTAITATLANSGVTAGTYTNATVTFDAKGRATSASSGTAGASSGAVGSSGLTMNTGKLLGRTTASSGAIEEIATGSAGVLSLSALTLSVTSAKEWVVNFTAAGDAYIPALVAMTIDAGNAAIGTGTIAYQKSTSAAPGTFSSTTLPATLQAGAWLKVSASSITGFVAVHLQRTA